MITWIVCWSLGVLNEPDIIPATIPFYTNSSFLSYRQYPYLKKWLYPKLQHYIYSQSSYVWKQSYNNVPHLQCVASQSRFLKLLITSAVEVMFHHCPFVCKQEYEHGTEHILITFFNIPVSFSVVSLISSGIIHGYWWRKSSISIELTHYGRVNSGAACLNSRELYWVPFWLIHQSIWSTVSGRSKPHTSQNYTPLCGQSNKDGRKNYVFLFFLFDLNLMKAH